MQFQYNADYPGIAGPSAAVAATQHRAPLDFPAAAPIPCARITTRVFHPNRNHVATVQNVLVRTMTRPAPPLSSTATTTTTTTSVNNNHDSFSSGMSSSSSSSSSDDSDDSMKLDTAVMEEEDPLMAAAEEEAVAQNAYWVQRTIREAIYGRVLFAVILKRRPRSLAAVDGAEWEVTSDHCAVKEMSWQHIRRERDRLAEDPIKEVSAMQYMKKWFEDSKRRNGLETTQKTDTGVAESFQVMKESNIMMPLDLLSDERNLYSIMPYCDGGELFERLDLNERFSEEEARYWMDQLLNGIENLQHVGICHRDMSLENLLVHRDGALIIDMGMCLMMPHGDSSAANSITASFNSMSVNINGVTNNNAESASPSMLPRQQQPPTNRSLVSLRGRTRHLISPQGTCGKWIYMSPEIYQNSDAFDGYAVDMWAAGVILFLMLTGFPPWERACATDERFQYMTAGYLVQMLTEWEIGLSSDSMDLLQRMLFVDPKDRLSLDQVRAHPWMVNGHRAPPLGLNRG